MPEYLKSIICFFASSVLLVPTLSVASQTGIPGYSQNASGASSCHACHEQPLNAPSNTLSITGSNTVLAGSTNSYTLKLEIPYFQDISYAGFDLRASQGTLLSVDNETSIINSELVHSNRKAISDTGSSYEVQWTFNWLAPATVGNRMFYACGLPVNGDGSEVPAKMFGSTDGFVACTTFNIQVQQAPSSVAGDNQTLTELNPVVLNGSSSIDADGSIVSYLWQQLSGAPVALSNPATSTASFTAPNVGDNATEELIFRLTVTDNDGLSDTDSASIFVQGVLVSNQPPDAETGNNQSVNENTPVNLDASGSTDDGYIASYLWEQIAGINSVVLNNANSVNPSFTAPAVDSAGDSLIFQLTVTDDLGVASTETTTVTINDVDTPPTAIITDASGVVISAINNNAQVTLYGNFSNDAEGPITAYSWSQAAGPAIINPGPGNAASFSFTTPDDLGNSIDIQLNVTGDAGLIQKSVSVTLILNNLPPQVSAAVNQTVTEGSIIDLHGSVSDANNNLSSVQWRQINCASNCIIQTVDIALPLIANEAHLNILSPSITPENSGLTLDFELIATDAGGLSATSGMQVIITDNGIGRFPDNAISFTSVNNQPMAIMVESLDPAMTATISELLVEDASNVSDNTNRPVSFPYGLINLEISLSKPGSVLVTLYFPEPVTEAYDFYQYMISNGWVNTTKAKDFNDINFDAINGWSEISEEVEFSADRSRVMILLTDGGPSDQNLAPNIISIKAGTGENQPSTNSQPGATGALNPLMLILFSLIVLLSRHSFLSYLRLKPARIYKH